MNSVIEKSNLDLQASSCLQSITVRPMHQEEAQGVLALIHQSLREINSQDYPPQQINKIIGTYDKDFIEEGVVLIAEKEDQIVGMAKASSFNLLGSNQIVAVFTHPSFLRQGIASALVNEIEKRADLDGVKRLSVASSLTAVSFYKSLGYQALGDMKILTDVSCVFLEKQINPSSLTDKIFPVLVAVFILLVSFFALFRVVTSNNNRELDFQRYLQNKDSGIKDSLGSTIFTEPTKQYFDPFL